MQCGLGTAKNGIPLKSHSVQSEDEELERRIVIIRSRHLVFENGIFMPTHDRWHHQHQVVCKMQMSLVSEKASLCSLSCPLATEIQTAQPNSIES